MTRNRSIKQTFQLVAPAAKSVVLAGDFTQWRERAIPMQRDHNGIWSASVGLAPGAHRYRFIVDGEWRDDPECNRRVPNPFGSQDMLREAA